MDTFNNDTFGASYRAIQSSFDDWGTDEEESAELEPLECDVVGTVVGGGSN